jgi:hypothetical protein
VEIHPAMTTVLLHCTLLAVSTAVCWMKIYVHCSHKFVWTESTFFFIFSSWLISCFNSPIVLKNGRYLQTIVEFTYLKDVPYVWYIKPRLYINTFLYEQEENSCSNSTNRTYMFPVPCTLLQLLLSTVFVKYFF